VTTAARRRRPGKCQVVRASLRRRTMAEPVRSSPMLCAMASGRRLRATQASAPSQREEQKAQTRARLIDAAFAAFVAKGYAATTIDDIVIEAAVSRATFYLHFSSKLELIISIRDPLLTATNELSALLPGAVSGGREGISVWLDVALDHWEQFGQPFRAIRQASQVEPELPEELTTLREDAVRGILQGIADAPPSRADERQVRARAAWGLLYALFDDYAAEGWAHGRANVHRALLDAWVALLT
jgi:AcrR family transcriptional regulator